MIYIILIGLSLALFGGFLVLVSLERARGLRVAGALRNKLDKRVARAAFIAQHVDWGAFLRHLVGSAAERTAHDLAHSILRFVRTAERTLTRFVKYLRERRGMPMDETGEESTAFQRALAKVSTAVKSAARRKQKTK